MNATPAPGRRIILWTSLLLLLPLLLAVSPALASDSASGTPYGPARSSIAFKLGGYFPDGNSELWQFNSEELTTRPEDFNDFAFAVEYTKQLSNYTALSVELQFYEGEDNSVDRRIGDLVQHSDFSLIPATVSLRFQPGGKYRSGSGYPGTPRLLVPYFSIGAGFVLWEFSMEGEFEDPLDPDFFFVDRFVSDGIAPAVTAAAGLEIAMDGPWSLLFEGRYLWAEDELGQDFAGFDDFDLSGASFFVGASFRF